MYSRFENACFVFVYDFTKIIAILFVVLFVLTIQMSIWYVAFIHKTLLLPNVLQQDLEFEEEFGHLACT